MAAHNVSMQRRRAASLAEPISTFLVSLLDIECRKCSALRTLPIASIPAHMRGRTLAQIVDQLRCGQECCGAKPGIVILRRGEYRVPLMGPTHVLERHR